MSFWEFFWWMIWIYLVVAYLMLLFRIIMDLFSDDELGGWAKAFWFIGLVLMPFLMALIYLGVRGKRMGERMRAQAIAAQRETDSYIRQVAVGASPSDQIATAKGLRDSGAITQEEFETLKSKALATA